MRGSFSCKPYREYVKANVCLWRRLGYMDCDGGPCDPQHDPPLGSGGDDLDCVPMCRKHHNLHKDKPKYYRSVITEKVLVDQKDELIRSFLADLGLETPRPVVKVPKRKQQVVEKDTAGKWLKPEPNSRPRGKQRKYLPINK